MIQLPQLVEVKGIRVLTSKQLAEKYGTTTDIIKKNFSRNRDRYVEGKHYISFTGDELKAFKDQVTFGHLVDKRTSHLYLWTEKGALLHAKSLNTDKAWEVYDYLVDYYFRAQEKQPESVKEFLYQEQRETALTKRRENETVKTLSVAPGQDKRDIAPHFRNLLTILPLESLDEMEKIFRLNKTQSEAIKIATTSILAEKMKRQFM